ncbi:MAG TPA: molybdopterin-binding protein [Methanospirillum sp.]|nr:molybdopterin-binding protein [Methanospirillum sp.]
MIYCDSSLTQISLQVIIIPRICINSQFLPLFAAKKIVLGSFQAPDNSVCIPVSEACGRILAEPVYSNRTNPPVVLSGPDGIAVKSGETIGAGPDNRIELNAPRVNTGMPMPEGFDAVIQVEEVIEVSENRYRIHTPVSPFQNTIPCGVDMVKGDVVLDKGHHIIPFDIGALLTYGVRDVMVKDWRIGLIATGDEVVPPNKIPLPGQIIDSNSSMIGAYLKQYGITPVFFPIVPDDPASMAQELQNISKTCDMVLIFGGSSAGSKDYTVDALEESGTLLFHGVGMAPGKPVSLAQVNGKPVIGMPGPSIGSLTALHVLLYPLLRQWGVPIPPDTYVRGELTESIASFDGFDMFLMMHVHQNDGKTRITPVERKFGQMMGVRADAVLHVGSASYAEGQEVEVRMIRSRFSA